MAKARVAVLISGKGTNMAALLYASRADDCPYEIVLVASNDLAAPGLALAEAEGVRTFALSHRSMPREQHDAMMHSAIGAAGADFIALAGYMRVLTPQFVAQWEGRMLNIHPSLLPLYPGLDTHQRALDAGDSHAGCSVHLVTAELDGGPILAQCRVVILPGDNVASLAARVRIAEHQIYPKALAAWTTRLRDPEWLTQEVRTRALAQPDADENLSHGMTCFGIIGGKKFAYVSRNHHGDGMTSLLVKISGADEQAHWIEQDPDRFYRPAYFGDGWLAIRLDLGDTDWDAITGWLERSWRHVAPKKLTRLLDAADQF
jgi:formyltetrahydrofolate-dependent phosphoribosylglycinamide formyltransferase